MVVLCSVVSETCSTRRPLFRPRALLAALLGVGGALLGAAVACSEAPCLVPRRRAVRLHPAWCHRDRAGPGLAAVAACRADPSSYRRCAAPPGRSVCAEPAGAPSFIAPPPPPGLCCMRRRHRVRHRRRRGSAASCRRRRRRCRRRPPLPPAPPPPPPPCDRATVEPAASARAATDASNVRFMFLSLESIFRPLPCGPTRRVGGVPRAFQIVPICDVP